MILSTLLMLLTLSLSLFHFLYGYKEALRISEEKGLIKGWSVIISFPLAFIFAHFANLFHSQL
ncbi:hypothetical protein [Metabacillus fastidiosus]|uniref:hypothetical protein n=1 Tax=Metabacillus fastidiosus TaxID=1458 RepID=UPI003D2BA127